MLFLSLALCACTSGASGGGGGGGGGTSIPSGIFYVNEGTASPNTVGAFSTSQIAGGGQLMSLPGSPFAVTGQDGHSGAPFGIALALGGTVLYVVNADAGSVTAFPVNANGTLGTIINHYAIASTPSGICVDPSSQFAAAVVTGNSTIQPYAINPGGSLTAAAVAGGGGLNSPVACAYSGDGKYLYVSNEGAGGGISGFSVSSGGTLSPIPGSPWVGGTSFQGIVASTTTVFAASQINNGVDVLAIASGSGALVSPNFVGTAFGPIGLTLSPGGKYLYVAASAKRAVDGYVVSGQSLTPLAGTPYTTTATKTAVVSVNSAGTLLVALDEIDNAVTLFAIRSDGTLAFAPSAEYVFGSGINPMAVVAR